MFQCADCSRDFRMDDVRAGKYFPSTSICLDCYQKRARSKTTCFGKATRVIDGRMQYGYDATALPCSSECPDRRICRSFVKHRKDFTSEKEIA